MSVGLMALLDDVAGLAKVAAASVDDVIGHAAKASAKSAGVVIDDTAVTPRYVVGFSAERELPIIARIARGSLVNKLVFLLPAALLLSAFAPWAVTPLLMLGGGYLCFEGAEKVYELVVPHDAHAEEAPEEAPTDAASFEEAKVASAVRTDFILSAEIMAIALAAIPATGFWTRAFVLAAVGILITAGVYGLVALIVKADDAGLALARIEGEGALARLVRRFGLGLVRVMPPALSLLAIVGTAAMIWVGGGILIHGLESFGLAWPAHVAHDLSEAASHATPLAPGFVGWLAGACWSGLVGLVVGLALIPVATYLILPLARSLRRA